MAFNYETYLTAQLNYAMQSLQLEHDLEITTEQAFIKKKSLEPNTIYFLIKYLSSTNTYEGETKPIQIMALCEQNTMEDTRAILDKFATDHNFEVIQAQAPEIWWVKQEYSSPVVMSNFNEVSFGYRSLVYLTGTLYILNGVTDIQNLTIDNASIKPLSTNITYTMSGNTQPVGNGYIAQTVKNVSTFAMTITIPAISTYSTLISKIMNIASATNNDSAFAITFSVNSVNFSYSMRMTSMVMSTAPNEIPSIQVGLIV